MINEQPIEKTIYDPEGILDVHSVWSTIQGEGPFAGTPAVFVRLAGCNLQCQFCDTDYISKRSRLSPEELCSVVKGIRPSGLVVLTGGEPFRQNITPFYNVLRDNLFTVQVETNGTLYNPCLDDLMELTGPCIVCSPKTGKIHPLLRIDAYKYVLDADHVDPDDGLPSQVLGSQNRIARPTKWYQGPVFIQPMDMQDPDENTRNLNAAVESCKQFGYTLCLQVHKIAGVE